MASDQTESERMQAEAALDEMERVTKAALRVRNLRELEEFADRGTAGLSPFGHTRLWNLLRDLLPFTAVFGPAAVLRLIAEVRALRAVASPVGEAERALADAAVATLLAARAVGPTGGTFAWHEANARYQEALVKQYDLADALLALRAPAPAQPDIERILREQGSQG